MPGLYHFPQLQRGDTFLERDIATLTQDGVPLALTSARLQVRPKVGGMVLLEWDTEADPATATITGEDNNMVHLAAVPAAKMRTIPTGNHVYDLEVVFASGSTLTILAGNFPVMADITRND